MEIILFVWVLGSILVGHMGADKRIGYWGTVFTSFFLSRLFVPVGSFIIEFCISDSILLTTGNVSAFSNGIFSFKSSLP